MTKKELIKQVKNNEACRCMAAGYTSPAITDVNFEVSFDGMTVSDKTQLNYLLLNNGNVIREDFWRCFIDSKDLVAYQNWLETSEKLFNEMVADKKSTIWTYVDNRLIFCI